MNTFLYFYLIFVDDAAIKKSSETVLEEDSNMLDVHLESSNSFLARDDHNGDVSEVCGEKQCYDHLNLVMSSTLSAVIPCPSRILCPNKFPYFLQDSNQENKPESSPFSSPSSSFDSKKVEGLESASEIPERQSPVSVLEPLFIEEDVSPASIRTLPGRHCVYRFLNGLPELLQIDFDQTIICCLISVELPVQPVKIQFEDPDTLSTDQHIHLKTGAGNWEPIEEFIKAVLLASGMKWDELYMRFHSTTELVDPSICDEVEFFPNQLCCDKKLLFDGINEVLMEVYGRYLVCYPGLTCIKRTVRPVPNMKNAISEVCEGIHWNLLPLPLPSTLDHLVKKDLSKTGAWMDLQFDAEAIIVEIGNAIFEDLVEETVVSCTDESSESSNPSAPAAPRETSIDL